MSSKNSSKVEGLRSRCCPCRVVWASTRSWEKKINRGSTIEIRTICTASATLRNMLKYRYPEGIIDCTQTWNKNSALDTIMKPITETPNPLTKSLGESTSMDIVRLLRQTDAQVTWLFGSVLILVRPDQDKIHGFSKRNPIPQFITLRSHPLQVLERAIHACLQDVQ